MYPDRAKLRQTSAFGRLDVVSGRERGVTYIRADPPSQALLDLVADMKKAGMWDYERGCPKGCGDPVKWRYANE